MIGEMKHQPIMSIVPKVTPRRLEKWTWADNVNSPTCEDCHYCWKSIWTMPVYSKGYSAPMIRKQFEVRVTPNNQSEYLAGRRIVRPLQMTVWGFGKLGNEVTKGDSVVVGGVATGLDVGGDTVEWLPSAVGGAVVAAGTGGGGERELAGARVTVSLMEEVTN